MKEIITFDVYIDEDDETGIDKISLVKKPAIMANFIAMSEQEDLYKKVIFSEDEKRTITGAVLIPELPIKRLDENTNEEYYIKYSAIQCEQILKKFARTKDSKSVNKDHKIDVDDIYVYEQWLTGKNDKTHDLGLDYPERSIIMSMKVDNEELWQDIKSGKYKGFSLEGLFKFKLTSKSIKQGVDEDEDFSDNCECSKYDELSLEQIEELKLGSRDVFTVHPFCNCKIKQGEFIPKGNYIGKDGKKYPCPLCLEAKKSWDNKGFFENVFGDTYYSKKYTGLSVELSVTEDFDPEKNSNVEYNIGDVGSESILLEEKININMVNTILKDGTTLYTDEAELKEGSMVYTMDEAGNKVDVKDGEYITEDESVITIVEKKVVTIVAAKSEMEADTEAEVAQAVATLDDLMAAVAKLQASFDMLMTGMTEQSANNEAKLSALEVKLEEVNVSVENKKIKSVEQSIADTGKKVGLDYNTLKKYSGKF